MVLHRSFCLLLICLLTLGPSSPGAARNDVVRNDVSLNDVRLNDVPQTLYVFPGNHGFIHETGYHVPMGWAARYRIDLPGNFIQGRISGGEELVSGTYRYVFYLALQPGKLGGLLKRADDVARVEVWDRTANERLIYQTFQIADFPAGSDRLVNKTLVFSTWKRQGHRFEPRIFWTGLSGLYLQRIELQRLADISPLDLAEKAQLFENEMGESYLDRGFVVSRRSSGDRDDLGDAEIWTGLYAAAEAWRYQATRSPEPLARMQASLRALHQSVLASKIPGTLVRYVDANGHPLPDPPSKDSYTGFFFAVANCWPVIKDRRLKKDLQKDVEAITDHLLDHDLAFVSPDGGRLEFNPFPSKTVLEENLRELNNDPHTRRQAVRLLEGIQLYFLTHGQRPWQELKPMIRALKHGDLAAMEKNLLPVLRGTFRALNQFQRNVQRSDYAAYPDAPYGKLNGLLQQVLKNLTASLKGHTLADPSDVKLLPSQALHALHFIKVAGEILPKPNRFDDYYRANLWENKMLLKTLQDWNNMDEETLTAVVGHTQTSVMGSGSRHLPFLALYDLIRLEKDPALRARYEALFEDDYFPMQEDFNAMLHIMRGTLNRPSDQTGLGLWSLELYPTDRRGLGTAYWKQHAKELALRNGGLVMHQTRDPVPVNERQRDTFIWQRSSRSIGGDDADKWYPPLDYLFVYWLARANHFI